MTGVLCFHFPFLSGNRKLTTQMVKKEDFACATLPKLTYTISSFREIPITLRLLISLCSNFYLWWWKILSFFSRKIDVFSFMGEHGSLPQVCPIICRDTRDVNPFLNPSVLCSPPSPPGAPTVTSSFIVCLLPAVYRLSIVTAYGVSKELGSPYRTYRGVEPIYFKDWHFSWNSDWIFSLPTEGSTVYLT